MTGTDIGSSVTDQNVEEPTLSSDATLEGRCGDAGSAEPTLLWIDDEISRESGDVTLLEFEGYIRLDAHKCSIRPHQTFVAHSADGSTF
jgi:hypothetical protein